MFFETFCLFVPFFSCFVLAFVVKTTTTFRKSTRHYAVDSFSEQTLELLFVWLLQTTVTILLPRSPHRNFRSGCMFVEFHRVNWSFLPISSISCLLQRFYCLLLYPAFQFDFSCLFCVAFWFDYPSFSRLELAAQTRSPHCFYCSFLAFNNTPKIHRLFRWSNVSVSCYKVLVLILYSQTPQTSIPKHTHSHTYFRWPVSVLSINLMV